MKSEDYKLIADTIPKEPGIYKFLDENNNILYVGKAINLRSRLSSYFGNSNQIPYKAKTLVRRAASLDYTIVETEHDALLLENTLIKKFQPRYNIMLKDGKSYTYICIKNERFPRVFFTRKVVRDGSTYFGPYTSKYRAKVILELVKKLFQLRTCSLNLSESRIKSGKYSVCLEYHIKNCKGPCVGRESEQDYNLKIEHVHNILKGNLKPVKDFIYGMMEWHSEQMQFEQAQELKDKLYVFDDYHAKSAVVSASIQDVDVFSVRSDPHFSYVNYLKVVNGALINTDTLEVRKKMDEDDKYVLEKAIPHMRERFNSIAPEIIVPIRINTIEDLLITIPKIGDKKKLLELSEKNVIQYIHQKSLLEINKKKKKSSMERVLTTLRDDLHMDHLPLHIECFDNSNLQGAYPVAACVVFRNAKPSVKEYRHFNIKSVEGPNDFASMAEIVYRRYKRILEEKKELPQLIIVDGGKGQLSAAVQSLERLNISDKVTMIGIAKRLEEIYFPGDSVAIYINKKSESLKLIQHARNEAHRFAISFHRNKRSRHFTHSQLTDIPGIGAKTAEMIIRKAGSIKRLLTMDMAQIEELFGKKLAQRLKNHLEGE
ncbi:MAG TPA: excinuclease ABC subunit UvrC [Saprospiraceae bacterium]|nr:excinuclease ABC subunit UvrC [Saprospiraceae bacterium]